MDRNNYINSDHVEVYKEFNNELKEISEIINKYTEINEVLILAEGMIDIDLAKFISNLKTKKIKKLSIEYCGNEAMKELCNFFRNNIHLIQLNIKSEKDDNILFENELKTIINLKHIELNCSLNIENISKIIQNCKYLEYIKFPYQSTIFSYRHHIKNHKFLKVLDFKNISTGWFLLYEILIKNTNIIGIKNIDRTQPYIEKIELLLDLNINWKLEIDEASYEMIREKINLKEGLNERISFFCDKSKKKVVTLSETSFLYWVLNHFFPKDIILIILKQSYWVKILNEDDKFVFYKWRKFNSIKIKSFK